MMNTISLSKIKSFGIVFFSGFICLLFFQNFTYSNGSAHSYGTVGANYCDGNYARVSGKAMFFYQGDYNTIASDADQLACLLAKYDMVQLTHAFDVKPAHQMVNKEPGPWEIKLKNGGANNPSVTVFDGAYIDSKKRRIDYVIAKIRELRAKANQTPNKIYAYVPATADNALGGWNNTINAQNFLCPRLNDNYTCQDFNQWIDKWVGLCSVTSNACVDGFFIDMVNPFYIHQLTWTLQTHYIKSKTNPATGHRYPIMANSLATEAAYYYPSTNAFHPTLFTSYKQLDPQGNYQMQLGSRPIPWIATELTSGDSILIEGFYVKAGKANQIETMNVLSELRPLAGRGISWSAIGSEKGYEPPMRSSLYTTWRDNYSQSASVVSYVANPQNAAWLRADYEKNRTTTFKGYLEANNIQYLYDMSLNVNLAKYFVDWNMMQTHQPDKLCELSPLPDSNGITAQDGPRSCLSADRFVRCESDNFRNLWNLFLANGGEYLTYSEANLGTYSNLISSCPLVGGQ